VICCFSVSGAALYLLSFPTRRSSDLILVEAMACGVPVVGSATGEVPEVVGEGGVVVPEGDAAALAAALRDFKVLSPEAFAEAGRSEEHTSELQSRENLVCRLLLEKKK